MVQGATLCRQRIRPKGLRIKFIKGHYKTTSLAERKHLLRSGLAFYRDMISQYTAPTGCRASEQNAQIDLALFESRQDRSKSRNIVLRMVFFST